MSTAYSSATLPSVQYHSAVQALGEVREIHGMAAAAEKNTVSQPPSLYKKQILKTF
jgi:hypothetical protein